MAVLRNEGGTSAKCLRAFCACVHTRLAFHGALAQSVLPVNDTLLVTRGREAEIAQQGRSQDGAGALSLLPTYAPPDWAGTVLLSPQLSLRQGCPVLGYPTA